MKALGQNGSKYVQIRGRRLYVEVFGDELLPPVLYLHGGPGTGAFDFTKHQQKYLSSYLHVIAPDQRGVLRSGKLQEDEPFGLHDLIEDCEALRQAFSFSQWAVLGHSFGGYLAALYALTYPNSVQSLVFENPSLDLGLSARSILKASARAFNKDAQKKLVERASLAAESDVSSAELWEEMSLLLSEFGPRKNDLYVFGKDKDFFETLQKTSQLPVEQWDYAAEFQRRLFEEGRVFEPILPRFAELKRPTLLLKGRYDPVTDESELQAYESNTFKSRIAFFENSSHFIHVEEPEQFAKVVTEFVLEHSAS